MILSSSTNLNFIDYRPSVQDVARTIKHSDLRTGKKLLCTFYRADLYFQVLLALTIVVLQFAHMDFSQVVYITPRDINISKKIEEFDKH